MRSKKQSTEEPVAVAPSPQNPTDVARTIDDICFELAEFLKEKNRTYGNSALDPSDTIPTGCTPLQQIKVRINDKLKRLRNGQEFQGDDTWLDLTGYFVLYLVARRLDVP